jgi:CRP/FNR family cyclic AMP-dependent transcriptional regulator
MDGRNIPKLRTIPIFSGLDDGELERIAAVATEFEAAAGHVLTQPGQEGSGMFILEEGSVAVELRNGTTVVLGPGEFFGELAILGPGVPRTARVRATTPVRCLAISRSEFDRVLREQPAIAVAMLPVLARRIADLEV